MVHYPDGDPAHKHDLLYRTWPPPDPLPLVGDDDDLDEDDMVSEISTLLQKPVDVNAQQRFTVIYSYDDGPTQPPLAHPLTIVGFVAVRQPSVLATGTGTAPSKKLQVCVVTVKRAYGRHRQALVPKEKSRCDHFAVLLETMANEQKAALVYCKKQNRAAILWSDRRGNPPQNETSEADRYAGLCYYGTPADVATTLAKASKATIPYRHPHNHNDNDNDYNDDDDDGPVYRPSSPTDDFDDGPVFRPSTPPMDDPFNDAPPDFRPSTPPMDDRDHDHDEDDGPVFQPSTPPMDGGGNDDNDSGPVFQPTTPPMNGDMEDNLNDTSGFVVQLPDEGTNAANGNNDGNGEMNANGDQYHSNAGAAAADKFYSELNRQLSTRANSLLYHMRSFNGWVKAAQISELNPECEEEDDEDDDDDDDDDEDDDDGDYFTSHNNKNKKSKRPLRVLDLACGKGGDLKKWTLHKRGVDVYVGADVARGSLREAAIRAKELANLGRLTNAAYVCADLGQDVLDDFCIPTTTTSNTNNENGHGQGQGLPKPNTLLSWRMDMKNEPLGVEPHFQRLRWSQIRQVPPTNNNNNNNKSNQSKSNRKFDVISIQFAIHYMMQTRERARRFFTTVGEQLVMGGNLILTTVDARVVIDHLMGSGADLFSPPPEGVTVVLGHGICKLHFGLDTLRQLFGSHEPLPSQSSSTSSTSTSSSSTSSAVFGLEYTFTLLDHGGDQEENNQETSAAVDLPEWLVPMPTLVELASEAGLELDSCQNFHEFYEARADPQTFRQLHQALYRMKVLDRKGTLSQDEWDVCGIYMAVKFRKVAESKLSSTTSSFKRKVNEKEFLKAMMSAKRKKGAEWNQLTQEEKKVLAHAELQSM